MKVLRTQNIINARELGGYVMADGSTVKDGLILRGSALDNVSDDDIRILSDEYRLRRIIDLRSRPEVDKAPDKVIPGTDSYHLDVIDHKFNAVNVDALFAKGYRTMDDIITSGIGDPLVKKVSRRFYAEFVSSDFTLSQYARFMRLVIETPPGAVFFHCSQGKDRTGLGSAFILTVLGASRDTILGDFEASRDFYIDIVDSLLETVAQKGADEDTFTVVRTLIGVNVDYFREALDYIEDNYGGRESFLHNKLLLTDADIALMRERYLQ